jgi:hypothetical protein
MSSKASRRFYNQALKASVYDACPFATENRFAMLNAISVEEYLKQTVITSGGWTLTTYVPPPRTSTTTGFSQAFQQFDPGKKSAPSSKKAKLVQEPPVRDKGEDDNEEPKRKKRSLFTRSVELQGQMRTYKVLMLPTREQKIELKRCFAVTRHAYNYANERIRRAGTRADFIELRNEWIKRPPLLWASAPHTKVATRMQQHAIKQCVDAYVSNYAIKKKNHHHKFEVKYRSLRDTITETLVIEKDQVTRSKSGVCTRKRFEAINNMMSTRRSECLLHLGSNLARSGGIRLQDSSKVIDLLLAEQTRLKENAKIMWDKRLGTFHFIYTYEQPKLEDPDPGFERKRIVATDPGLAPFQEWYSPTSGEHGVLLDGGRAGKAARCKAIDVLQARLDRRRNGPMVTAQRRRECSWRKQKKRYTKTTRRLRKRFQRACAGLRNWMENGHYAAANFLLEKHDVIIQPILNVKELTDTGKRNLNSKSARAMYTWGHYLFRQRLKSAVSRYPGRHVYETSEPGTSKTCTNCGSWNTGLKLGDKVFDCPVCHIQVDRQLAGARNNFFAAYGMAIGRGWDGVGG